MGTSDQPAHERGLASSVHNATSVHEPVLGGGRGEGSSIGRHEILRALLQYRKRIFITWLLVTAVVGTGMVMLPLAYTSSAQVLVDSDREANPSFFDEVASLRAPRSMGTDARRLETEMAILETGQLVDEVVTEQNIEYVQVYRPARVYFLQPVRQAYDWMRSSWFGKEPRDRRGFRATAGLLANALAVSPAQPKGPTAQADVIAVSLTTADPLVAQRALDGILASYLNFHSERNAEAGEAALTIVQGELRLASEELGRAEARLRDLISSQGGRNGRLLATPGDEASLAQMKSRLVELEIELLDARRVYREGSEEVQTLSAQVANLRERVDAEVVGGASNLTRENQLTRDVREAESRYTELLRRAEGIGLYLKVNEQGLGDRVVLEAASLPTTSNWKQRVLMGAFGSVFGLGLGILLAGLGTLLNPTFRGKSDIPPELDVDLVTALPLTARAEVVRALRPPPFVRPPSGRPQTIPPMVASLADLASSVAHSFPRSGGLGQPGASHPRNERARWGREIHRRSRIGGASFPAGLGALAARRRGVRSTRCGQPLPHPERHASACARLQAAMARTGSAGHGDAGANEARHRRS